MRKHCTLGACAWPRAKYNEQTLQQPERLLTRKIRMTRVRPKTLGHETASEIGWCMACFDSCQWIFVCGYDSGTIFRVLELLVGVVLVIGRPLDIQACERQKG